MNSLCEYCGKSDAVRSYDDADFCFRCHLLMNARRLKFETLQKSPKITGKMALTELPKTWENWLKSKGIKEKTIKKFDLQYDKLSQSLVYPLKIGEELIGYQLRDAAKKVRSVRLDSELPFLFEAKTNNSNFVVLVEDPISAMRIWQDSDFNAIALLGTHLTNINKLYILKNYLNIIVWMDGDLAGYSASRKITSDFAQFRTTYTKFTKNDPKDHDKSSLNAVLLVGITQ